MDNTFFRVYWGRVPERRSYQRLHYYYPNPYAATLYDTPVKSENAPTVKPKNIASIPVNFINSETPTNVVSIPVNFVNSEAPMNVVSIPVHFVNSETPKNFASIPVNFGNSETPKNVFSIPVNFVNSETPKNVFSIPVNFVNSETPKNIVSIPVHFVNSETPKNFVSIPVSFGNSETPKNVFSIPVNFVNSETPNNAVSIPVNFINSETPKSVKAPAMDGNTAAIKIQAPFCGFCVRKSRPLNKLRIIMKSKSEAAKIRRCVNDEHVMELIRRDEKERLKMRLWITSLLLRLEEIQGPIPFVRESRKAVIRELVNLQETVHDIIAAKPRQDATTEVSVTAVECPTVKENLNEKFKSKELPGDAIEVSVSNEKGDMTVPSQIEDLQIEGFPDEDNNINEVVEIFQQGSFEAGQIVSGTEECTMADGADKDAVNFKRNIVESPVLEVDASPTIPCTEEWVIVENSRDDDNSSRRCSLM